MSQTTMWTLLQQPRAYLAGRLEAPPSPPALFVGMVAPLAAVRAVAVLVRSVAAGSTLTGLVLALGSFVLQAGAWLGLALVLPAVARQFRAHLDERQGFALATYASVPLWLAGVLYVVPESFEWLHLWSRLLVFVVALYGLVLLHRGFLVLEVEPRTALALVASVAAAYVTLYLLLFTLIGVTSHVVLFVVGRLLS